MKKPLVVIFALACLFNMAAVFESFNYTTADEFKSWIEEKKPVIIVDIQVKEEFAKHHFPGSIETNAYPVKTEAEKKAIDPAVAAFKQTDHDVVVVCPRGGGGAKRCYSYLKSQGVPEEKLTILKGGVEKWPYKEMLTAK